MTKCNPGTYRRAETNPPLSRCSSATSPSESAQQLSQTTTPESGTTQYFYNGDGSLHHKIDQKNQKAQYAYDEYGRLEQIQYFTSGAALPDPCQTVDLYYDEFEGHLPGFGAIPWNKGRLTSVAWSQDASCTFHFVEQYQYTQAGLISQKRLSMATGNSTYLHLDGYFGHDFLGRMTYYQPPVNPGASNEVYAYQRDGLGRAMAMLLNQSTVVSNVGYGPAGQMTQMTYSHFAGGGFTETRQYNENLQMKRLTATPVSGQGIDFEYRFGSANNGRVWQVKDWISGEELTYQYDSLNRLTSATTTGPEWGLSFSYDGFGNLMSQTRTKGTTAPQFSLAVNAATNRISTSGYTYDANGNLTQSPGGPVNTYDVANRLVSNGASYDLANRRVWDGSRIYFYSPQGQLLGKYNPNFGTTPSSYQRTSTFVWFEGKPLVLDGQWVMTDRLGSVRANGAGDRFNYYPYGAEVTPTADGRTKFATYQRDSAGLDYAVNRYYANGVGRFMTPDPLGSGAAKLGQPWSWNQYMYVGGDPINFIDPGGARRVCVGPEDDRTCWEEEDEEYNSLLLAGLPTPKLPILMLFQSGMVSGPPLIKALKGLQKISGGTFKTRQKCRDFFDQLIKENHLNIGVEELMDQVMAMAGDAFANGYVYDGPSSSTSLDSGEVSESSQLRRKNG
jgi:RHS repeat-associated protein